VASSVALRAFARNKNHQPHARQSRAPPNDNRQRINHFAPRPPANPPPPGYTRYSDHRTQLSRTFVAHGYAVPQARPSSCAVPDLHARPKADHTNVSPRSRYLREPAIHGKAHPQSPERKRRVGPHRLPSAATPAGPQNPPRPDADRTSTRKSTPPDRTRHFQPRGDRNRRANPIPSQNRPRHVSKRFKTSHAASENHQTNPIPWRSLCPVRPTRAHARIRADFTSAPLSRVVRNPYVTEILPRSCRSWGRRRRR